MARTDKRQMDTGKPLVPLHTSPRSFVSPKIEIRESHVHGLGMFALEQFRQGEVVFIKGGHILRRQDLFFSETISSYLPLDDEYFIGATNRNEEGGIKLFINHACEPNCGIRGEITFVALRDIRMGEELTIDYAMVDNEDYVFKCTCQATTCRQQVTGRDWRIPALQKKYSGFFARYLADKMSRPS